MVTKTEQLTTGQVTELTDDFMRIATGRVTSTMLELVLDLGLLGKIGNGSVPIGELGEVWNVPSSSARLIAQALSNIGILRYRRGEVSLPPVTRDYLVGNEAFLKEVKKCFRFNFTAEQLKGFLLNPPPHVWYQLRDHGKLLSEEMVGQSATAYLDLWKGGLHEDRLVSGRELAEQYDFSGHRRLLDLGGASGGVGLGIRKLNPHLHCVVFDIPDAIDVAREKIAPTGEGEFFEFAAGSVFTDDLPKGSDVILMSQLLQVWNAEDSRFILRKVYDLLEPGGVLLVKEPFFEDDWTGVMEPLLIAFMLFGAEGKCGQQLSYGEMEQSLSDTGFVNVRRGHYLVIGEKP